VLYALLYGREVFADENQFARLAELVKSADPEFDPAVGVNAEVSGALLGLTRDLLKKNVGQRPASIFVVKQRLNAARAKVDLAEPLQPLHGYMATALTGLNEQAREGIAFLSMMISEIAKEYDLYIYQPRKFSDPILNPQLD